MEGEEEEGSKLSGNSEQLLSGRAGKLPRRARLEQMKKIPQFFHSAFRIPTSAFEWFLNALFPPQCLICRKEGDYLCQKHNDFPYSPSNEVRFKYLDRVIASTAYYHPVAQKTVEYFKFRGFRGVAKIMALKMVQSVSKDFFKDALMVPVPLHWTRHFWRGFNQSEVLAQEIQKDIPTLEISKLLKRNKRTFQQAQLGKSERQKNLANAFAWRGKEAISKRIILIDDVVASGATLDSAAEILKKQGAKEVYALVFARGGWIQEICSA